MNELGNKISICRQNKNLTQEELAKRLGVTPQAVSKWERNISLPDTALLTNLCKVLEVNADYFLGLDCKSVTEDNKSAFQFQEKILDNLRNCLEPVELLFGKDIIPLFLDGSYKDEVAAMRERLSREGILVPVIRIRDELQLGDSEVAVLSYGKVLHKENVSNKALKDIVKCLEYVIKSHYAEVLTPDLVKCLTDNLKLKYPALIEGVVPERISYGLLTQVLKGFVSKGNSMIYLPRIIEYMQYTLLENTQVSVEDLGKAVSRQLEYSC